MWNSLATSVGQKQSESPVRIRTPASSDLPVGCSTNWRLRAVPLSSLVRRANEKNKSARKINWRCSKTGRERRAGKEGLRDALVYFSRRFFFCHSRDGLRWKRRTARSLYQLSYKELVGEQGHVLGSCFFGQILKKKEEKSYTILQCNIVVYLLIQYVRTTTSPHKWITVVKILIHCTINKYNKKKLWVH